MSWGSAVQVRTRASTFKKVEPNLPFRKVDPNWLKVSTTLTKSGPQFFGSTFPKGWKVHRWPSGPRRQTQVLLPKGAWVRTPLCVNQIFSSSNYIKRILSISKENSISTFKPFGRLSLCLKVEQTWVKVSTTSLAQPLSPLGDCCFA